MSSVKPVPIGPPAAADGQPLIAPRPSPVEVARAARAQRARRMLRNLLAWVGTPTLIGIVYFVGLAHDQYESFATLSVPPAQSAVLREFALSRDMLSKLELQANFSQHYQGSDDVISGLAPGAGSERRYESFLSRVELRVEESGIFHVRVRAFAGPEAQRFAQLMVSELGAFLAAQQLQPPPALMIVARPSLPTEHTYPRRIYGIVTVFLVSLSLFGIGSLLVAAAREHAQF